MAIYRDTGVFCLSITGTENFLYRPLLSVTVCDRSSGENGVRKNRKSKCDNTPPSLSQATNMEK